MAATSFYRAGQPVRVPVSPTSGATQFDISALVPTVPDLTFMFVNPNPFDIRLEGTPSGAAFMEVTASTGWLILARSMLGPFTSKKPMKVSAQAFATPGKPLPSAFDYTGCVLEMIYGRGQ